MSNENEVRKTTTEEKGAVVDVASGTGKIPAGGDTVKTEQFTQTKWVLEDTPANRDIMSKILARNGFHREAAELLGKKHEPSILGSAKNLVTENTTIIKGLVTVAIGAFTYYLGKKAFLYLSKKMGWNLFTDAQPQVSAQIEPDAPMRSPRRQPIPQMPQASA